MIRKAISSAMNVASGTRKLLDATTWFPMAGDPYFRLLREDEDEQHGEGEVDEVHRLNQADRQEEQGLQAALGLRLPGDAGDELATGQAVTARSADRAAAQGQAATDEAAGELDRLGGYVDCHFSPLFGKLLRCVEGVAGTRGREDQCAPSSAGRTDAK